MVHAIVKAFIKNQMMLQDQVPLTTITCKMKNNTDHKLFLIIPWR
jgi:hypothetical protein